MNRKNRLKPLGIENASFITDVNELATEPVHYEIETITDILSTNNDDDFIYKTYNELKKFYIRSNNSKSLNDHETSLHSQSNDNDNLLSINDKYFGNDARNRFQNRYNWILNQNYKSNYSNNQQLHSLRFDNELNRSKQLSLDGYITDKSKSSHIINSTKLTPITPKLSKSKTDTNINMRKSIRQINSSSIQNNSLDPLPLPLTPRSRYIASCIRDNIYPVPSLVIRKNESYILDVKHLSIGDSMADHFSKALEGLPCLESLNIEDNRLTDKGLVPILQAIGSISTLKELNLSYNIIGPKAAEQLSIYLCNSNCQLEILHLEQADVDDFECKRFVEILKTNKSLKEIDLSKNKIGTLESLNKTTGGIKTGSDAIAEYLSDPSCRLRSLKLNWNMIRLQGGLALATSLSYNQTLTYLDLSYNSLGREGSIALSTAIQNNKTLEILLLTNNSIDFIGCFCLVAGILENKSLKKVTFDGNPIGELGSKAAMMIPIIAGNRVKISLSKCIINMNETFDSSNYKNFDFNSILGDYSLNLSDGYERAIAIIILYMIAGHPTYSITSAVYMNNTTSSKIKEDIEFIQILSKERVQYFDHMQIQTMNQLEKLSLAYFNSEYAIKLFHEVDADDSGMLDKNELAILMKSFGVELIGQRLNEVMDTYDVNGEGLIDLFGFMVLLKLQYKDASYRLQDLTTTPILTTSLYTDQKRYIPPTTGTLQFSLIDTLYYKPYERILTDCDKEYIFEVANPAISDSITLMSYGINSSKLRLGNVIIKTCNYVCMICLDEGLALYFKFHKELGEVIKIVCKLLPSLYDSDTVRQFLKHVLGSNRSDLLNVKNELGYLLRPLIGSPNGYYELDLSKMNDRECLCRLLIINNMCKDDTIKRYSSLNAGRVKDTSQHGNYSCFRNEFLNGNSIILDESFIRPNLPLRGKLEFDFFVMSRRPLADDILLSDKKFLQLLLKLDVIATNDLPRYYNKLKKDHNKCGRFIQSYINNDKNNILDNSTKLIYELTLDNCNQISQSMKIFYGSCNLRNQIFNQSNTDVNFKVIKRDSSYSNTSSSSSNNIRRATNSKLSNMYKNSSATKDIVIPREESESPTPFECMSPILEINDNSLDKNIEDIYHQSRRGSSDQDDVMADIYNAVSRYESSIKSLNTSRRESVMTNSNTLNETSDDESAEDEVVEVKKDNRRRSSYFKMRKSFINKLEIKDSYTNEIKSIQDSSSLKAKKYLDLYIEVFGSTWIYARQLGLILDIFYNLGSYNYSKYFGTYRVELFITLYDRIIDTYNIDLVYNHLTNYEIACIYCRVGILNVFNPIRPYGSYDLDLSKYEERKVCKMIMSLVNSEGFDRLVDKTFRWDDNNYVPGWDLPVEKWSTDEGLPTRGCVTFTYLSISNGRKKPYNVDLNLRRSLLYLVLIDENELEVYTKQLNSSNNRRTSNITNISNDIINDKNNFLSSPKSPNRTPENKNKILPGKKNLTDNLSLWTSYLTLS